MFGYLCLVNPDRPAYTFADRQMLSIVASQAVAICEENHSLMQTSQLITMGNLTSELAHDLKTPLANVRGILQTLDGKWDHENTRTEAIDMIMEEIDRANSLALDLLSFSKNQELDINYCNIHDLLSKALMITRNTLNKAGVQAVQNFCKDSLMVWANENELIDSFVNIIVNAVQAMPEGGTLTISTRNNLHQSAGSRMPTAPVRFAEIEIIDTGIGMTRKEMDRIFERFYTTKEAGTGLGLAIVSRVVKRYQGFIDVKSEKDKGSTFIINLPQR
jgi:signal transduction histidine kinase